jgi:hypothetical protein
MNSEYYYFGLYENRYLNKKVSIINQPNRLIDIFEDDFQCLLLIKKINEISYDIEKVIYSNLDDRDEVDDCILKIFYINNKLHYEFQHKKYNYVKKFSYEYFFVEKSKINKIYNKRLNKQITEIYRFLNYQRDNSDYDKIYNIIDNVFGKNNLFCD